MKILFGTLALGLAAISAAPAAAQSAYPLCRNEFRATLDNCLAMNPGIHPRICQRRAAAVLRRCRSRLQESRHFGRRPIAPLREPIAPLRRRW